MQQTSWITATEDQDPLNGTFEPITWSEGADKLLIDRMLACHRHAAGDRPAPPRPTSPGPTPGAPA